jgi:crossover junction endodeoxyribonuclease RuvC
MTTRTDILLAIDPGLNGAYATLGFTRGNFLGADELPRWEKSLDANKFGKFLRDLCPNQVVIERVHSMPKQGVASSFTFGMAYGIVIGIVCGAGLPIAYVTPQKWKSHFRLIGAGKSSSVQRVIEIYPDAASSLTLKKHHGRADAILLARYFLDATRKGEFV